MRTFLIFAAALMVAAPAAHGATRSKPDLGVSALTVTPASLTAGAKLTVRVTLRPSGAVKRSALALVLSTDGRFDAKDVRLGSRVAVPALRRQRALTLSLALPATLLGRRFVIACADAGRQIRERNERNNCRASRAAITIAPAPAPLPAPSFALPGVPPPVVLPGVPEPPAAEPDPDTTIASGPPAVTAQRVAEFAFTGTGAARFECRLDDGAFAACASPTRLDALGAGEHVFRVRAIAASGAADPTPAEYRWRIGFDAPVVGPSDAPAQDPSAQAPPTPPAEVTTLAASTAFLYTGANAVQTGVADGAITERRAAVVRGRVVSRGGSGVGGVRVTVLDHPELGRTATRADGAFDLAVNGGGPLTLEFRRAGFIELQRTEDVARQDYTVLEDVTLIAYDEHVTEVAADAGATQVARGAPVSDGDGARRATLLFEPATQAFMVMPDGSERALSELAVRATEYTVGERGPSAMPGDLPPTSAYTYAVEFSVDQALAAGAVSVRFTKPVANYVENFIGLPVGSSVPNGSYDRRDGVWKPEPDGVIVKIVGKQAGSAQLDADGDGTADSPAALASRGIGVGELAKLASLYEPGAELWRVAVGHFTPWDHNWPYGLPDDAAGPSDEPRPSDPPVENQCQTAGSIVGCELQTLGEVLPITGTPWALHYDTMRMPGRLTGRTLEIPVTGAIPSRSLDHVDVRVSVAGRTFAFRHGAGANQRREFTWDGRDTYGREVRGRQPAVVSIDYAYRPAFRATPQALQESFALVTGFVVSTAQGRSFVTVGSSFQTEIGGLGVPAPIGGWEISGHHTYDPVDQVLYRSDGTTQGRTGLSGIETAATGLSRPEGLTVGLDGSIVVADTGAHVIRRFPPGGGASTVIAGVPGQRGFAGDGGAATAARFASPTDVAVAPDGAILVADAGNQRIRRVGTDGTISTLAGTGAATSSGDGQAGVDAGLAEPVGVAADSSGAVLIVERRGHAVRRLATDGRIATVAGTGVAGGLGDGGPATAARLNEPSDVAFGPDGAFYIADTGSHRIRQVRPDGVIRTVAGTGCPGVQAPRAARCAAARAVGPATATALDSPEGIAVTSDGTLAIADTANSRIRLVAVSGHVVTFAGDGGIGFGGDGGTPLRARLALPGRVAIADGGALLVADTGNDRVRRIAGPLPGLTFATTVIPSSDGEALFTLSAAGRHERTLDALTGATVQSFVYNGAGLLTGVKDGAERLTTIARDTAGRPTAITGPDGQVTTLQTGPDGLLAAIEDPSRRKSSITYAPGGLLATFTDPASATSTYSYDDLGRLTTYTRAGGGTHRLARTRSGQRTTVTHTSAEGRTVAYSTETRADGAVVRSVEDSGGGIGQTVTAPDGSARTLAPGGDVTDVTLAPDPRFGMAAPIAASARYQSPAGRTVEATATRTVDLSAPGDPLSVTRVRDVVTSAGRTSSRTLTPPSGPATSGTAVTVTAAGRVSTTRFDAQRRILSGETPGALPTTFGYDAAGRPTDSLQGTRTTMLTYGADGYLQHFDDPWGRRASFVRDASGLVTQAQLSGGRTMTMGYDAAGRIASVTPPGAGTHAFSYTARGRIARIDLPAIDGSTSSTTLGWSDDDEPEGANLPGGETFAFAYDAGRRLTALTDRQSTRTMTYEGLTGRVASMTRAPESTTLTRDGQLPTGEQMSGTVVTSITRTFDAALRIASSRIGVSAPLAFGYDADGLLTGAGPLTIGRDAASGLARTTAASAVTTAYESDPYGMPRTESATGPGGELSRWELTRDAGARITAESVRTAAGTHTLSYDYNAAGRLRSVTDGAGVRTYAHDDNGNRLSRSGPGGTVAGTYDARDRLLTWNGRRYSYRATGEVSEIRDPVSGAATTYGYDGGGRLNSVTLPGAHQVQYVLDTAGRRIATRRDGVTTNRFVYGEALGPSAELDAGGAVSTRYVYGTRSNVPDVMLRDGKTFRLLHDARGSVRLVVDAATGAVAQRLDYDEFGRVTADTSPGFQPFGYAGGLFDHQTGLVLFGARDYDPETGRFMSPDPAGFAGGDGNLYLYTFADPVNWVDVTGEGPEAAGLPAVLVPIAIGGLLGAGGGAALGYLNYAVAQSGSGGCFSQDEADYQWKRGAIVGGIIGAAGPAALMGGLGIGAAAAAAAGTGATAESWAQFYEMVFRGRRTVDVLPIVTTAAGAAGGAALGTVLQGAGGAVGRAAIDNGLDSLKPGFLAGFFTDGPIGVGEAALTGECPCRR